MTDKYTLLNKTMFKDRFDAGKQLANALEKYKNSKNTLVLAIPRGALQIGQVVCEELGIPLDIIVTKKIPHPLNSEYAIGAVGPDGEYFVSPYSEASLEYIEHERKRLSELIEEKYVCYRGNKPKPDLAGKIVIIVDDGIATGSTILAAVHVIRKQKPARIVVAVPVGAPNSIQRIAKEADEMICLIRPDNFQAIGQFYENFVQVEDREAIEILKKAKTG